MRAMQLFKRLSEYWMILDRSGKYEICGERGHEIDEDWRYYIYNGKE